MPIDVQHGRLKCSLIRVWAEEADREMENRQTERSAAESMRLEQWPPHRSHQCSPAAAPAVRPELRAAGSSSASPPADGQPKPPGAWQSAQLGPLWQRL